MFLKKATYEVVLKGRTKILYKEGRKVISIDSELIFTPPGITIYTDNICKWDSPYDAENIFAEKKKTILKNIKNYLENDGYTVDIA